MSKVEVNTVEPQCGTTLTLGGSGDTVVLGAGASQSGFGRTGTVDWDTSIKTAASFSATNGNGYFVDTSSNVITVNLPAGSVGDIVAVKDYAQNFNSNNCIIAANGSEKIEGLTTDLTLGIKGVAVTLVYGDAAQGWQAVNSNEVTNEAKFVTATVSGACNTLTTVCTNYKVARFVNPGTFCVSCAGNAGGSNTVDYLVVAGGGGGGGGGQTGAGGGAGGYRESPGTASGCYSVSPLGAAPAVALTVPVSGMPITVGGGGSGGTSASGGNGNPSVFSTITSTAGGFGGAQGSNGGPGGSGGGSSGDTGAPSYTGGTGNTPPTNPAQGTAGTQGITCGPSFSAGGGGGATVTGGTGTGPVAAPGGAGATTSITSAAVAYAGGGGSGSENPTPGGLGGLGGGGNGGKSSGSAGTANTGGGGGGAGGTPAYAGANGGSGVVIIRYKFQ